MGGLHLSSVFKLIKFAAYPLKSIMFQSSFLCFVWINCETDLCKKQEKPSQLL